MIKRFYCFVIFTLGLIFCHQNLQAEKVPGFIITENSDTLYGEVKVSHINLHDGGIFILGINLEPLHFDVWFREYGNSRFKNFQAKDICGYGFMYKLMDYSFHSFVLESNTSFKIVKKRNRFLQLYYEGKVSLYRDINRMVNPIYSMDYHYNNSTDQSVLYYDYFIYNETIGLNKVEISDDIKTMNDLLYLYEFEKEFIERIHKNTKLKDIYIVLMKYEIWLKEIESRKVRI
jgi:hypothetical protein